ncbi:DUF4835 family protein [Dysgonomonas sp. 511]|uniref:type IX secretion system protein PorD n=1 Tax=Dysgonomonas sp. 511 TaxID=2302930 RepID=UPI0013D1976F|nr:DUF4835 family protein [Dysgonomonas sp. 511]NDV79099.1 DUF4835 family protein [Dysgonomonas sp. 511]
MKHYFIIYFLFVFGSVQWMQAQDLNAKLTINTQRIQSPDTQLFSTLETNLNQLLNEHKWTDATFSVSEKIECSITLIINEVLSANTFSAEIQISSRRPVYNSTYASPLFNYRDTQIEFSYLPGESLSFSSMTIDNNIVAVMAFYANIVAGLDFDSFSPKGGSPYFARALEIANMAQSLGTKGWEAFSGKENNRYDLAVALTEERMADFHTFWYDYHRMGLDEMAANATRGRIRVIESLNNLKKMYDARSSSILLTVVGEAKTDEILRIASEANSEEKQSVKKLLNQMFPTKSGLINQLK